VMDESLWALSYDVLVKLPSPITKKNKRTT